MKMKLLSTLAGLLICVALNAQDYTLVIHGGAGHILRSEFSQEKDLQYRTSLTRALKHGQTLLKAGASSVEVVESVLSLLENDSLFNAGRGSVLNAQGKVECDASIMSGIDLNAGAVAGVGKIKNPIQAARLVMEESPHVLLSGDGAEEFAQSKGAELIDNEYFISAPKLKQYKSQKKSEKHGTVGAVAVDVRGNLAAGTSTGGMFNKAFGRIGDSPIIGAGTYANNKTCAVSCTGHGEFFIRNAVAHSMSALMEYKGMKIDDAAEFIIHEKLTAMDAGGGLIGLDSDGNVTMQFNTPGMFRGYVNSQSIYVALYGDE